MDSIAIVSFANCPKGQSRPGMRAVMHYAMRDDKTLWDSENLVSGINCSPQTVYNDFISTKLLHGKDGNRMFYHMVQSFPKGEAVPPEVAHEMAVKLAAYFKDYEVLVCTHTDRDHIHSHFIINSVSFETGRKFHISTPELEPIRQLNDALCMEYGFEVCQPKPKEKRVKSMKTSEYHAAAKGESWKMRLINTVDDCMKYAGSKDDFIQLMAFEGYAVKWTSSRKNITYTTPEGKKCGDDKLHETKYLKEMMELEFGIRQKIIAGGAEKSQPAAAGTATHTTSNTTIVADERGASEQPLLQSADDFGRDIYHENADAGAAIPLQQPTHTDGTGANLPPVDGDTADALTGWEQERAFFFAPQAASADLFMDTALDRPAAGLGGLADNLVQLGRAVERLESPVPVRDSTTMQQAHSGRKKKLAVGQKEDDHSGYAFEMKM
ncbi:relaxase/mobilization nuclease domain-containing protein [Pygmaiobacter massiliensis]|uniref:relaxase/mobilization nuclease domain-containing protein n=1 Tax=Pygmaiobacter massiliensis TaxID=1917873 RepID=UPI002A808B7E|nr:relaxase/mobilization nuclease domain-containing protein [Pygmaiobacter massiliensis]MDY4784388.1 relaxase/mobilization nuclease domain-containing protein [Pygmaiobacter massiliensis]